MSVHVKSQNAPPPKDRPPNLPAMPKITTVAPSPIYAPPAFEPPLPLAHPPDSANPLGPPPLESTDDFNLRPEFQVAAPAIPEDVEEPKDPEEFQTRESDDESS